MSNEVTDRARVYVRFCFHFSLAGAWYPLPVLVTFFYSSQRGRLFDLWGGWGRRVWVIPGKKMSCRLISRGKKDLARKCLAKKNSYTEEKKNLLSGKKYHQRFGKKSPPPRLLLKANGRPLSIKLQLGQQVQQLQMDQNQKWQRLQRWEREQRRQHRCQTTSLLCYNN